MKKIIAAGTVFSFACGIFCLLLWNRFRSEALLSLTITFFTTFYHFIMRITVAYLVVVFRRNKTDMNFAPVKLSRPEKIFYDKIRIKRWKKLVPTYNPSLFAVKNSSLQVLLHNMIDARIGHEIIVVLSFVPLLFSKPLGGTLPFLITSVLAAVFDMQFVLIQRYNIARLSNILIKAKKLKNF